MPEILRMPEVAAGAESALLSSWSVGIDEEYAAGGVIAVIETDKAVVDMEADAGGRILRTLVAEGAEVAIGDPIAVIAALGEAVDDVDAAVAALGATPTASAAPTSSQAAESAPAPTSAPAAAHAAAPAESAPEPVLSGGRIFISPIARKRAADAGVDITAITGTGPNGRIRRRDVEAAIAAGGVAASAAAPAPTPSAPVAPAVTAAFEDIPHTRLRKTIATRLTQSVTTAPHFYVKGSARVDRLMAMRAEINSGGDVKVSVNDLLIKAMARAHTLVPAMNVTWADDFVRQYSGVDIAVAVATETGLVTPVLRGVESMSVTEVARQTRDLAERARDGQLRQHELEGGSTSISNLGMFGTEEFTAIINPPHASILAVGAARPEPVVEDGQVVAGQVLRVVLSVDHRPVDGAIAAQWMREFTALLESPARILA